MAAIVRFCLQRFSNIGTIKKIRHSMIDHLITSQKNTCFFSLSIKYLPKKKQNNRRTASSKLLRPLLLMGLRMIQHRNAAIRVVPQGLSQCPVTCRGFTRGILAEKHNTLMIMITNHE